MKIESLNYPGTTGLERSALQSKKVFGSISEEESGISGAKPKVSDSRFRFIAYVLILLCLLCKSYFGLLTSDAKLVCCAVEVC